MFCIAIVLAVFAVCAMAQPTHPAAPREVLVKFRALAPGAIQQIAVDEDLDMVKGVGGNGVLRLRSRSKNTDALVAKLQARADVEYAEPNYIVTAITTPTDPYYTNGNLWGMPQISAPDAWGLWTGSKGVVVGVVDSGVDYTHPDLAANIWSAPKQFQVTIGGQTITCPAGTHGFNAVPTPPTCYPMDDNDHGTHVSGTIGALANNDGVVGVNWTASIIGLKFLGANGSGYTSDAVDAIEFAVQVKQIFGADANIRVLSNSWGGGGFSQTLLNEINKANGFGMLFVAAAGNSGRNNDSTPSYPASYAAANVIAVAATDRNDVLASWSNYGATSVDLAAPGVGIWSTIPGGYASFSGTSMATPHVSGAAALILSYGGCSSLSTSQVKDAVLNNVDPVVGLAGKTLTSGRLNVSKAIQYCQPSPSFSLSAAPSSLKVIQGRTTTSTVTVNSINGFRGSVSLECSGGPSGVSCGFSPQPATVTSTLTITASPTTPRGTYRLAIIGTSGTMTRSTSLTLTVSRK